MISIKNTDRHVVNEINRFAVEEPASFVRRACDRYADEVERVESWLNNVNVKRRVLLLSGPSSSGKTITANLLREKMQRDGVGAYVVSLDDFYLGKGCAPRLPDGSFDYESPDALDLPQLATCICELLENGRTLLPQYDFATGVPKSEKQELVLEQRSVVIFEGIHALHPKLRDKLPQKHVKRLLINTRSAFFTEEGEELLSSRQIRLIRRMVRDERHRNTTALETLKMWPQVTRGEEMYLFPYVQDTDMVIDTTHAFEPGMFAARAIPLLSEILSDPDVGAEAEVLLRALQKFTLLSESLLPAASILQEFFCD